MDVADGVKMHEVRVNQFGSYVSHRVPMGPLMNFVRSVLHDSSGCGRKYVDSTGSNLSATLLLGIRNVSLETHVTEQCIQAITSVPLDVSLLGFFLAEKRMLLLRRTRNPSEYTRGHLI